MEVEDTLSMVSGFRMVELISGVTWALLELLPWALVLLLVDLPGELLMEKDKSSSNSGGCMGCLGPYGSR